MKTHVVKQGEYLSSIAKQYKFARWQTIYHHPDNAEFRRKRPNPNVILAGDRLVIPDLDTRTENCSTGKRHCFRLTHAPLLLKIVLRDDRKQTMPSEPYELQIGEVLRRGTTNSDGLLEEKIPVGTREAALRLTKRNLTLPLAIGDLDPIESSGTAVVTGAQARLNNLGFLCGDVDDDPGPQTTEAIRAFQRQVLGRENADGRLDPETRNALVREHGC